MRAGRLTWSFVDLSDLGREELRALTIEAWSTVAPKRVVRAFDTAER